LQILYCDSFQTATHNRASDMDEGRSAMRFVAARRHSVLWRIIS